MHRFTWTPLASTIVATEDRTVEVHTTRLETHGANFGVTAHYETAVLPTDVAFGDGRTPIAIIRRLMATAAEAQQVHDKTVADLQTHGEQALLTTPATLIA